MDFVFGVQISISGHNHSLDLGVERDSEGSQAFLLWEVTSGPLPFCPPAWNSRSPGICTDQSFIQVSVQMSRHQGATSDCPDENSRGVSPSFSFLSTLRR